MALSANQSVQQSEQQRWKCRRARILHKIFVENEDYQLKVKDPVGK
jgi:hypothetical protein